MKKIFLLKSLPGSGKSTLVNEMTKDMAETDFAVCSADDFFTQEDGTYEFDRNLLGDAHGFCHRKFREAIEAEIPNIFISNCNLTYKACKYYIVWGDMADYEIHLIEPKTPWANDPKLCFKKGVHNVPMENLIQMKNQMQSCEDIARFARENLGVEIHYDT